jgi:hypothetical protein
MMIMTVHGNCRVNGTPSLGRRGGLCHWRGGSAHPDRAGQQDNQHTTSTTLQVRRGSRLS